jgi:hypothetical protein
LEYIVQATKKAEMNVRFPVMVATVLMSHFVATSAQSRRTDPFEFLRPTVQLSADDKRQLDDREVVLKILPASGHELATLAAASLNIGPDAFIARVRNIVALKKGPNVPQIGKFSTPPTLADLQSLTLDESDVDAVADCKPNRCALKLHADEIDRLHRARAAASGDPTDNVRRAFREIVLERTQRYLANGAQDSKPQFQTLLANSPFVSRVPQLATYLERFPAAPIPGSESFLYWSKETYAWNPMISVTQVTILRNDSDEALPEVLVVSRDIFATRYTGGSLVLSSLIRDPNAPPNRRYLVYLNRTWVDGIRAFWRPLVEYRVKSQARKVFAAVRDRLEQNGALSTQ